MQKFKKPWYCKSTIISQLKKSTDVSISVRKIIHVCIARHRILLTIKSLVNLNGRCCGIVQSQRVFLNPPSRRQIPWTNPYRRPSEIFDVVRLVFGLRQPKGGKNKSGKSFVAFICSEMIPVSKMNKRFI